MRAVLCLLLLFGLCAQATVITVSDEDVGATSAGPFPESDAANNVWSLLASPFGTIQTIDFEAAPVGFFTTLSALDLGVSGVDIAALGDNDGDDSSISATDAGNCCGFNTTSGGENYLSLDPEPDDIGDFGLVFNFTTPVSGFGARFIGVATSPGFISVEFDNGTAQTFLLSGSSLGGSQFFGFVDDTNLISSVSVWARSSNGFLSDSIGIDDVQFVSDIPPDTQVPEPSSAGLALLGLAGVTAGLLRRRQK